MCLNVGERFHHSLQDRPLRQAVLCQSGGQRRDDDLVRFKTSDFRQRFALMPAFRIDGLRFHDLPARQRVIRLASFRDQHRHVAVRFDEGTGQIRVDAVTDLAVDIRHVFLGKTRPKILVHPPEETHPSRLLSVRHVIRPHPAGALAQVLQQVDADVLLRLTDCQIQSAVRIAQNSERAVLTDDASGKRGKQLHFFA